MYILFKKFQLIPCGQGTSVGFGIQFTILWGSAPQHGDEGSVFRFLYLNVRFRMSDENQISNSQQIKYGASEDNRFLLYNVADDD